MKAFWALHVSDGEVIGKGESLPHGPTGLQFICLHSFHLPFPSKAEKFFVMVKLYWFICAFQQVEMGWDPSIRLCL